MLHGVYEYVAHMPVIVLLALLNNLLTHLYSTVTIVISNSIIDGFNGSGEYYTALLSKSCTLLDLR